MKGIDSTFSKLYYYPCLKALYYARICSYAAYYAQIYAGIIHQGLNSVINAHFCLKVCYLTVIELWVHISDLGLKLGS